MKVKIQYLKILEYLHLSFNKWPPIQYKLVQYKLKQYLLFFETTIMEKTADLAMIQKTNIDTLHKEGKFTVSKHIKCKVDWKEELGRKRCTSNRDDCKLENTVKQSWFKHCESFTRSGLKLEVSASRVTTLRRLQGKRLPSTSEPRDNVRSILTWAVEKKELDCAQSSKVLFSDESTFCISLEIKVPESGGRVERHRIHVLEVQCEVSTVSDDSGCHVICWCWFHCVFSEVHSQRSHPTRTF